MSVKRGRMGDMLTVPLVLIYPMRAIEADIGEAGRVANGVVALTASRCKSRSSLYLELKKILRWEIDGPEINRRCHPHSLSSVRKTYSSGQTHPFSLAIYPE